jgi:pimeloyl-ACP methyl ester carboxylesterase
MLDAVCRLVNKPGAGHAFSSFQKNEVGWNGLHTSVAELLHETKAPVLIIHGENDGVVLAA